MKRFAIVLCLLLVVLCLLFVAAFIVSLFLKYAAWERLGPLWFRVIFFLAPLVLYFFTRLIVNKIWQLRPFIHVSVLPISALNMMGTPDASIDTLKRRRYIWYTLAIPNIIILLFSPSISRIFSILAQAFFLYLCFGSYMHLHAARCAKKKIPQDLRKNSKSMLWLFRVNCLYIHFYWLFYAVATAQKTN